MKNYESPMIEQVGWPRNEIEPNINILVAIADITCWEILSFTNAAMADIAFKSANIND